MKLVWMAAVVGALSLSSANAAPIWDCSFASGWGIDRNGAKTPIPSEKDFSLREFSPPNKMLTLHAPGELDKKVFDILRYEQVGSTNFGHGIIKDGAFKMTVSEVLNDNESVLTVIFEAGPQVAMVKTSKCERVQ